MAATEVLRRRLHAGDLRADLVGRLRGLGGELLDLGATTAKPRPASPARAASMVALSASRLVCSAIAVISFTTSPMRPAACDSSLMRRVGLPRLLHGVGRDPARRAARAEAAARDRRTPVIPVGGVKQEQKLLKITRRGATEFAEEDLGGVMFVPLIGEHGWTEDGRQAAFRHDRGPCRR